MKAMNLVALQNALSLASMYFAFFVMVNATCNSQYIKSISKYNTESVPSMGKIVMNTQTI